MRSSNKEEIQYEREVQRTLTGTAGSSDGCGGSVLTDAHRLDTHRSAVDNPQHHLRLLPDPFRLYRM